MFQQYFGHIWNKLSKKNFSFYTYRIKDGAVISVALYEYFWLEDGFVECSKADALFENSSRTSLNLDYTVGTVQKRVGFLTW